MTTETNPMDHQNRDAARQSDLEYMGLRARCCGHHPDAHEEHVGCLLCGCAVGVRWGDEKHRQPMFQHEVQGFLGIKETKRDQAKLREVMARLGIRFRPWKGVPGEVAISATEFHQLRLML